jgi:hypothetical protein
MEILQVRAKSRIVGEQALSVFAVRQNEFDIQNSRHDMEVILAVIRRMVPAIY